MENVEAIYSLSPTQLGILFHTLHAPESGVYFIQFRATVEGNLNLPAFEQAWQRVVERHSILRTCFYWQELDKPLQVVHSQVDLPWAKHDWRGFSSKEQQEQLEVFLQTDRQQGFSLNQAPMTRFALIHADESTYHFVWTYHHLLLDGWSVSIILKEVFDFYEAFSNKNDLYLEQPRSYRDYIVWLQQQDISLAEVFWKQRLKGFTSPTPLGLDKSVGSSQLHQLKTQAQHHLQLSAVLTDALKSLAAEHHLTLNTLVQGAWALLLSRYSGEQDVVFGATVSGRPPTIPGVESMVGLFINTLPIRVQVSEETNLLSWLQQLQQVQIEQQQYSYSSLVEIHRTSDVPQGLPLFESIVVFENYPMDSSLVEQGGSLKLRNIQSNERTNYPLTLVAYVNSELFLEIISTDCERFDAATIARMTGHLQTLLEGIVANLHQHLAALSLLTEPEQHQLLVEWNQIQARYSQNQCIHKLFETQVEKTPDAVAVVYENEQLTYRELNTRANQLAHYLQTLGVGPEVLAGICVERSPLMVIGLLGILKAGGAYVPLDPVYPQERLAFMLEDSQVRVLLTQQSLVNELPEHASQRICLDSDWKGISQESADNPINGVQPENLAYIIYTSGSTGKPKGVLVSHNNVTRLFAATQSWYHFNKTDVWTFFHSFAFDFSVWELWGALLHGGKLIVVPYWFSRSPEVFYELLCVQQVTVLNQTPSAFRQLIRVEENLQTDFQLTLRLVIFGGEALELQSLKPWFDRHGDRSPQLVNMYGITETTVHVTYRPVVAADLNTGSGSVIGRAIPDLQIYVLDQYLQPVPIGVAGEMYVGGEGVARGYLNRPELTAERFILNPFSNEMSSRLYKTGDLARYLPNGDIEYLGRIDHQLKIRGFRIEIGEIEAVLSQHPQIRETVVLASEDEIGHKRLIGYIVPFQKQLLTISDLRHFLKKKLPDYMIPSAFVLLEALPLTPNGKINKQVLPAPDAARPELAEAFVAPRTPQEQVLADIWARVLSLKQVGIHDNFFVLGGDSIRSIQICSQAQEQGLHFSLQQLFQHQTIYELVRAIEAVEVGTESSNLVQPFSLISPQDKQSLPPHVEDAYPLSQLQMGMLFHSEYSSYAAIYHNVTSCCLQIRFDLEKLQTAIQQLAVCHPMLRTAFDFNSYSEPLQLVHQSVEVPLQVEDIQHLSWEEQQEVLAVWFEAEKCRKFDWGHAPLLRFHIHLRSEQKFQFSFTEHHAILDGWSVASMITELFQHYFFLLGETEKSLAPVPISTFRDYVALEQKALQSESARNFWLEKLSDSTMTKLPRWSTSSGRGNNREMHIQQVQLTPEVSEGLRRLAQSAGVPLKSVLLAAHLRVLSLLSGQSDVLTGLVSNGRPEDNDAERTLGLFLNTIPFRLNLPEGTWVNLMQEIFKAEQELLPFRRYPMVQMQKDLNRQPLFETAFNFTHFHVYQSLASFTNLEVSDLKYFEETDFTFLADFSLDVSSSNISLHLKGNASELYPEQMEAISGYYSRTLTAMAREPYGDHRSQRLVSDREWHQLVVEWNDTQINYPKDLCLHELFEEVVEQTPDAVAVVFEDAMLTYRELNIRANQLAHHLQSLRVEPEVLVGFCVERSLEMVVGLLGILKAGGAYLPLDPSYPKERLAFVLSDSQTPVLVTQQSLAEHWSDHEAKVVCLDRDWSAIAQAQTKNPCTQVKPDNLAYTIYTSGSTGTPKGVLVCHQNVVRLLTATQGWYNFNQQDVWTLFHSYAFDFSVWEMWGSLLFGGRLVVVPYWVSRDPEAFYQQLCTQQVSVLNQTPSAFGQLIRVEEFASTTAQLALRLVIFGGEALSIASLKPWFDRHGDDCPQLVNMYGITETTVHVSYRPLTAADVSQGTGSVIGRPIQDMQIYVLDQYMQPVPIGVAGEMYVAGDGLARGYLRRPQLTAERFILNPLSNQSGQRLYKTSDLARYLPNGEIEYLGRLDHQVKIRGFRIELGEIEAAIGKHPGVREAVVLARADAPEQKQLVAYVVPGEEKNLTVTELRQFLQQKLPEYMVPAAFILLKELPLTQNGKVDRRALPTPDATRPELVEVYVAPRTQAEQILAQIWAQVLNVQQVGIHENYFALGGDSIRSLQVQSLARAKGLHFSLQQLFQLPTIYQLVKEIESKQTSAESWEQFEPLSLISEEDRQKLSADIVDAYPLTMLQMGMLFHSEYSPDSAIYHDIFSYYLQAPFDLQVLQTAIQQLAARHPVLQTSFALSRFSEPLQLMHRQVDIPLQVEDLRHLSTHEQQQVLADWFEAEKQRPFDWSRPPLLRFQIHQRSKETFDFTVSFHHAILDGWSVASMLTELFEHYFFLLGQTTQPLPPAPISSFRDFVALEKQALQSQECKDYWLSKLRQHTMTQLPYWSDSSSRGDVRQIHLHTVPLAPEVCQQLQQLAHSAGVPLKSVLLAAHIRVLSLLSNNSDVLTGLVTNGRREEADGERVLGLFLNTVPLRMNLSDGTWIDLVQQAFQAEQELLPFRRYPMAQIQADLGGQPLFETVFNFINFHVYQGLEGFSGLEVLGGNFFEQTNITFTANFGLDVSSSQITVLLNGHATKLSAIEMELIGGYYSTTLSAMAHDALSSYQSQRLLSNQEWHQLLVEWNNTQVNYPQDKCIHQLFEAQVEQTPDAVAVVFQDQQLTYGELNHHANQLAHYLQTLGVGPEVLVGIFMKRSLEMVIGLFGILKAGGAYVPLDPTYPKERLAFMLEDAQVPVLLTQQQLLDTLPEHNASVVCLDRDWQWIAAHKQQNPTTTVQFHDLAYIIYTSGSTGKPKGVAIEHRGVVNFLSTMQQQLRCQAEDTLLSVTTISFDIAVLELFLPLVFGAKVVLVSREVATDGSKLLQQLSHSQPTFMQATPATWQMLLAAGWQGNLQMTVLSGGEALPRQLAQQLRQRGAALWNLYGPTETTIWSTTYRVDDSEQAVLIGRPIANTQLYILDRFLQPVPVGVAGELYIGGFGVARGYLNRPELTAQKFIPNPYATVSTNQHTHQTGTRLYKTGDLACYLPDGNIKFLGRIDNQVKIRGFRIELGEIEARLAQHPDVQQAVVITRDDVSAGKQLVAYVVFNQHQALSTKNLRDFLKQKLPEYMVPANFVFLDALPLTSNGKVNYRALPNPTPSHSQFELESNFVAPRTPLEEKLSCIWAEVLGLERVGIDDNFFELGGHSLLATRLISRVRDTLSIELPLRSLFNAPTVASLTKFIELNYWAVQEQKLSLTPTISDREEGEL